MTIKFGPLNNKNKGKGNKGPKHQQGQTKHGGKHGNGGFHMPEQYGQVGGYKGVNTDLAQHMVNQQYQALINQLKSQNGHIRGQSQHSVQQANQLYNRTVGDVNHIYDEVGGYMKNMGGKIHDLYGTTMGSVGANDAALGQHIISDSDAHQQAAQAEMARLGMTGQQAQMDPRYAQDAQFAQQVAAQTGANNQANLSMQQANGDQISALLGGMSEGSRAAGLGQAANMRQSNISDIRFNRDDQLRSVMDSIRQARMDKPNSFNQLLLQLQGQGFDQWMALQGLNLDRSQLAQQAHQFNAGMAQDAAYNGTAANLWQNQASDPSSAPYYVPPKHPGKHHKGKRRGGKKPAKD